MTPDPEDLAPCRPTVEQCHVAMWLWPDIRWQTLPTLSPSIGAQHRVRVVSWAGAR